MLPVEHVESVTGNKPAPSGGFVIDSPDAWEKPTYQAGPWPETWGRYCGGPCGVDGGEASPDESPETMN